MDEAREGGAPSRRSARPGLAHQLFGYFGVSGVQTFVEFGVFAVLQLLHAPAPWPGLLSIVCSGTFNYVMNRNVTFRSSSNVRRSILEFVALYAWNYLFLNLMLRLLPAAFGWDPMVVKLFTMACQGVWGFLLCKFVIFK